MKKARKLQSIRLLLCHLSYFTGTEKPFHSRNGGKFLFRPVRSEKCTSRLIFIQRVEKGRTKIQKMSIIFGEFAVFACSRDLKRVRSKCFMQKPQINKTVHKCSSSTYFDFSNQFWSHRFYQRNYTALSDIPSGISNKGFTSNEDFTSNKDFTIISKFHHKLTNYSRVLFPTRLKYKRLLSNFITN